MSHSHSVIELAQLLTGALDENFNIKNQSAVVKVVTCLEAFNITHESYREVQNTRIIKDLQALRQNKANDQVLAKRIKNLLRKWKERLASSTTAPLTSSQPNSPQNFSQGSSDTQFMTQSQSPPNSLQPPPSSQRIVNGPTSFKNLLPKSQQQNHHHHLQQPITSPVPSHIHLNGIDTSSSSSLLGKRKMPSSSIANNNGADIDENSNNHSRKKIMKKTNISGAILSSTPLTFNANNNSNSNSNIHNNNQHINKIHSNVPVVPQSHNNNLPYQNHPPPAPVSLPIPSSQSLPAQAQLQLHEQPKKRGRRKGSKGIDSQLNGNIPDFQAEIQQKIALSAGKRNKTTFELQQMLESHQNTSMSWTNGDVLDSSSLDRVNFNNTSSSLLATYNPPEPMYSSFDEPMKVKNEIKKERIDDIALTAPSSSLTIEDEIAKLQALLPPIDYEAAVNGKFNEHNTYDEHGDLVECTCTFREVITYADEVEQQPQNSNGFDESKVINNNNKININGDNNKPDDSDDDDDDETDDFCAVEDVEKLRSPSPPLMRSAVKSIFDPEYDANENLIEEMVRQKPRDSAIPKIIEVKIEKDAVKSSRIESMMTTVSEPMQQQQVERVPIINYVCDEDPNCPAREHLQRDPIKRRDVERLHKTFIEGINGYRNGIVDEQIEQDYSKDNEGIDYAKHELWKRVVPRYNFLTLDKVPKTFDDSPFSIPPKISQSNDDDDNDEKKKSKASFNDIDTFENGNKFALQKHRDIEFREWHEVMNVKSYNDEILTILPYVVID